MRIRVSGILFPVGVLLSGCTTLPQESVSAVDEQAVARVETAAVRSGVRIYWINKPQKSASN